MNELGKRYKPSDFEEKLYKMWVDKGYFTPETDKGKKPFTIVIPPPNITGQLHMGHALDETLQDILIRYKRMQGYSALWLPGTDHASIATEVKIVEKLREEGLTKYDLGRDKFLERAWEWKRQYGGRITEQIKKLGSSCDWSRERFTLDERCSKAVKEVFYSLYKKGLIYRGNRIINWCPECKTALSDAEVEYQEEKGHLWHIRYPFEDGTGYVTVATTRPETMLGDTAVAVNPDDERYADIIGKTLVLPIVGRKIPVITDKYVDKTFGTGAVKITPAHDPNDFEVGLRHNLDVIKVIQDDGTMSENAGIYKDMDRYKARECIVERLKKEGLLVKAIEHIHNVGHCYRCHTTVEPLVSKQWFVAMKQLASPALEAVKCGDIKFIPERFTKIYINWMENIKDWCISRQLWWGHRIPAWYCNDCGHITVSTDEPVACEKCKSKNIRQDDDVLDTWFSSALWPFSTMGWPDKTCDLNYFYPTEVLVTGYDIIFFWVARMVFMSLEFMQKPPFKYVFIHGLVRDEQGRKMSKSLGNGIDPLEIIQDYGADTLRFTLVTNNSPGNDMRFSYDRVEASRNFANKIWNASRFALMNLGDNKIDGINYNESSIVDKWILQNINTLIKEVTENLDKFELGIAAQKLYSFIWYEFCDWFIELTKVNLSYDGERKNTALNVLFYVLDNMLRLLHPFMPFITEEIWQSIPHEGESIVISSWPEVKEYTDNDTQDKDAVEMLKDIVKNIRNIRSEVNVPLSKTINAIIDINDDRLDLKEVLMLKCSDYIKKLANIGILSFDASNLPEKVMTAVFNGGKVYIALDELVDVDAEKERLSKELQNIYKEIDRSQKLLSNKGFTQKAPKNVIDMEKDKYAKYLSQKQSILDRINELKN